MEKQKEQWVAGYKEVKNYMHNELGITKEHMDEIIAKIVRDEVKEVVGQNGGFIRRAIREIMRDEMVKAIYQEKYPSGRKSFWEFQKEAKNPFSKFISDILKEEIVQMLRNQFEVGVEIKQKPEEQE